MNYQIKDNEPEHLKQVKKVFEQVADFQERKGILKYGKPLNPHDNYDWLDMALQEQVDGTKYLVAEMEKRKLAIERIRTLAERCDVQVKTEINHWLEFLEGR